MVLNLKRWKNIEQDRHFRNETNDNWDQIEGTYNSIEKISDEAKNDAESAKKYSEEANRVSENVQMQLHTLVLNGDSSVEAAQARVDFHGEAHPTLKARLDTEYTQVHSQLLETNSRFKNIWIDMKAEYGLIGDGTTDETSKVLEAIAYVKTIGGGVLYFPNGTYRIKKQLRIDFSNVIIMGQNKEKTILKFTDTYSLECIKLEGTPLKPLENVHIQHIQIDYTKQLHKGGLEKTPFDTHPAPYYDGGCGIRGLYLANGSITHCKLNDIYGDGIKVTGAAYFDVSNNILLDCGGSNIVKNGMGPYDNYGDSIIFYESMAVSIRYNTVINKRTFKVHYDHNFSRDVYGLPAARTGIEYEYPLDVDGKTPIKYANDMNTKDGYGLTIENNYVYGFTKCIHLESTMRVSVIHNTFLNYHIGIMYTGGKVGFINTPTSKGDDTSTFGFNYFDDNGLGKAPQGGYDVYYGGIAVSEYGTTTTVQIVGNTIYGAGKGIILGRSGAHIHNNNIKTLDFGIYNVVDVLKDIMISGNAFEQTNAIRFSNCIYIKVSNNSFIGAVLDLNGSDVLLTGNNFVNSYIRSGGEIRCLRVTDNSFLLDRPDVEYVFSLDYIVGKLNILGNNFTLSGDTGIAKIGGDANDIDFSKNRIVPTGQPTRSLFTFAAACRFLVAQYNSFLNPVKTLFEFNWVFSNLFIEGNVLRGGDIITINSGYHEGGYLQVENNSGGTLPAAMLISGPPAQGKWLRGDRIYSKTPSPGSFIGWVCIESGEPGRWRGFGRIEE
ncbi:glycosyl hydrolase family 28-related protein [Bacillus cereus group sp. BfR-BA-01379]|uniref:glycosyl hydrolase family 28-related protein n=1 Tax=Bacillus cereus group sp. BfR-BA-01379 TaxID=2920323 RepID=UPI001F563F9B|nr:glycosyl hydrolase family 28-related protein [Bacillus cereus group sp. BfR-BA-01379]